MKKKIFLSLLVVLSLFLITGCFDKKQQDEINKALNGADNIYINSGGTNNTNDTEPNNSSEPQDNKINNKNELLVGIWQTDIAEYALEVNGKYHGALGRNFYIFNSDGTWDYVQVRIESYNEDDIYNQLNSLIKKSNASRKYSYDGKKIQFDVEGKDDDYHSETDLTINGNSFKVELDYGRYLKEDRNMQIGKFTKYR